MNAKLLISRFCGTLTSMGIMPLSPRALYVEVAEALRQRIYQRDLLPGAWIDEIKIAEEFGISRTPLREALKVLASEGLITMKVRRGAYVTEVSSEDLAQVYHLLALLESDAAAVAAKEASLEELERLRVLHTQLEQAASVGSAQREIFFQLNEAFHRELLMVGQNRWRLQMVEHLRKVMKLARQHSLLKSGRIAESLDEHRVVMRAIEARDPEAARRAIQVHFENGLRAAA
jgi:DNA-binding GntR family transcriptional regulator